MEFKDEIFNGKTVAEIFAQRGKEVNPSEMIEGEVYLLTKWVFIWDIIHRHSHIENTKELWAQKQLFDDGDVFQRGCISENHMQNIFEATQDQIELLNSKT